MTTPIKRNEHLIVGAGLGGLTSAAQYHKSGVPTVIYEKEFQIAGIWNAEHPLHLCNSESRPQIDPVVFRLAGDFSPFKVHDGQFGGIWQTPGDVVEYAKGIVEKEKLQIVFGRTVLSWKIQADSCVEVVSQDVKTSETKTEIFKGFHIRIGNQHSLHTLKFPNEKLFKGLIGRGINDDIPLTAFKDKNVVIVGTGASATDSASRALISGAKKITIVGRHKRLFYPSYATYTMYGVQNKKIISDPTFVSSTYDLFFNDMRKMYEATHNTDFEEETAGNVVKYLGKYHLRHTNGFDSLRGDTVLLGMKYGIVNVVVDEVSDVSADHVLCKEHSAIPCDIFIKCVGYSTSRKLIENHSLFNGFFIENYANVTNGIGVDSIHGTCLRGPKIPAHSVFLANVFGFELLDKLAIFFQQHPEKWVKFFHNPLFAKISDYTSYDGFDFIQLLPKVLTTGDEELIKMLVEGMAVREAMRDKLLPPLAFLQYNKKEWTMLTHLLSQRTGQPEVPFPFDEELQALLKSSSSSNSSATTTTNHDNKSN